MRTKTNQIRHFNLYRVRCESQDCVYHVTLGHWQRIYFAITYGLRHWNISGCVQWNLQSYPRHYEKMCKLCCKKAMKEKKDWKTQEIYHQFESIWYWNLGETRIKIDIWRNNAYRILLWNSHRSSCAKQLLSLACIVEKQIQRVTSVSSIARESMGSMEVQAVKIMISRFAQIRTWIVARNFCY